MAHFAEIDQNNVVLRVLVVPDEQEHRGQEFLANDLGLGGTWIQTSYNNKIRLRFAGIGSIYLPNKDIFINRKPFDSWILNETTWDWEAPLPYPQNGKWYYWDESTTNWVEEI